MPLLKCYKFFELDEINHFLSGGIRGTTGLFLPRPGGPSGVSGLTGRKLTFTNPAGTVTFTDGVGGNYLLFKEVKAQIEAAIPDLLVRQTAGALAFIEKTPTTGVVLKGDGTADTSANTLLGFDGENTTTGRVYGSPYGDAPTAPYFVRAYAVNDAMHVVIVME